MRRLIALSFVLGACSNSSSVGDEGQGPTSVWEDGGEMTGDGDGDGDGDTDCSKAESDEIWCPPVSTTWQWQLSGTIDTQWPVDMFDIDLFDAPDNVIETLHARGVVVICYFSAGSHEDWRADESEFPSAAIGDPLDDWPGERWIDHRAPKVRELMATRIAMAAARGCDGVEPDNVDGYANDTGFDLTASDQLDFNRFLATQAHQHGLSVGLKNDLDQVEMLEPDFDWALNEECMSYDECNLLTPFIDAGKAVFHTEYVDHKADGMAKADAVCPPALALEFSTLVKYWDLDAWGIACNG